MRQFYLAVLSLNFIFHPQYLNASTEDIEPKFDSLIISSAPQAALVDYKDFTFNPQTLSFEDKLNSSGFWQRAGEIGGELGAYFTEKHRQTSLKLDQETIALEELRANQSDSIRLQESVVQSLSQKQDKYSNIKSIFSALPIHLNHIFYLLTLKPDLVSIHSYTTYNKGTGKSEKIKYCDFNYQFDKEVETLQPQIDPKINISILKEEATHILYFLKDYAARLQDREENFMSFGKAYLSFKSYSSDPLMLSVLETFNIQSKKLESVMHNILSEKIKEFDEEMEDEVAPLGEFHTFLVQTIESFQAELKAKTSSAVS